MRKMLPLLAALLLGLPIIFAAEGDLPDEDVVEGRLFQKAQIRDCAYLVSQSGNTFTYRAGKRTRCVVNLLPNRCTEKECAAPDSNLP